MNRLATLVFSILIFTSICFSQTPGLPTFSVPSGFYEDAFSVEITTEDPSQTLIYTIDGSDPVRSSTAVETTHSATVSIDPTLNGRPLSPGFVLRACQVSPGLEPSFSVTKTYIFLDKVLTQKDPGGGWPNYFSRVNQAFDYEMDSRIVNGSEYKDDILPAMTDIPSISVVVDPDDFFSPETGFWVHAEEHGKEWERPASFEIIYPDVEKEKFPQTNCGIRVRGGASRSAGNPKHAFRLFFREEYGTSKLEYPLFGDEGVDVFDKIDFRTSQNYAWSFLSIGNKYNTMNREVFSRDMQKHMEQPYTRSRYYHIYLNGMYWGLYMTQERSEARFAESYFGGDNEEYDVVKSNKSERNIEATDGDLDQWETIYNLTESGFEDDANYLKVMGIDATGNPDPDGKEYVDADNLIDYMIIIFFTGNFDAPITKYVSNDMPNNMYCIGNRLRKRHGFMFFQHDAEHSLHTEYGIAGAGEGLYENRVNLGYRDDNFSMDITNFTTFNPQYLHHKLMANSEFKQLFIDRVYKWFLKTELLQTPKCQDIFNYRADQIDLAIIAESARWGDRTQFNPRTKNDDWLWAIDNVNNVFFTARPDIVLDQIKEVDWYPSFDAPEFHYQSNEVKAYNLEPSIGEELTITNPNPSGEIYYTLDGSDPRNFGGSINTSAFKTTEDAVISFEQTTRIRARIKDGDEWSALNEINLLNDDDLSSMIVSEIHYKPLDSELRKGKVYEFVEFKNTSSTNLNLSNVGIEGGISFWFDEGTILPADSFIVIAADAIEFKEKYLIEPTGEYKGSLANEGEGFGVYNGTDLIMEVAYTAEGSVASATNGTGYSLKVKDETSNALPNTNSYWTVSSTQYGTPFSDDIKSTNVKPTEPEPVDPEPTEPDAKVEEDKIVAYPNPTADGHVNLYVALKYTSLVSLELYTTQGQKVQTFFTDIKYEPGKTNTPVSLKGISAGIYLLKATSNGETTVSKLVIQR